MSALKSLIVLTAGGTGGHVFPAEALAAELLGRGHRLALVTDDRGQAFGGALAGLDTYRIAAGGIAGRSLIARLKAVAALGIGVLQARRLLKRLDPAAVVGFGGYASVPAMMAATGAGCKTALHEQNAVLGRANRLLAARVTRIATCYTQLAKMAPSWQKKATRTGMPVRPAISRQRQQSYPSLDPQGPIRLLVLGGSQGARIFSEVVPAALALLPEDLRRRLDIAQQCRPEDLDAVRAQYAALAIKGRLERFFEDVPERLAAAHLVITRSGASTVAELTTIGRPAILVPYPHAIDDHQTANARAIDASGGGWLIPQTQFSAESLAEKLRLLLTHPEDLAKAAQAAYDAGTPDAAARLADLVARMMEDSPEDRP